MVGRDNVIGVLYRKRVDGSQGVGAKDTRSIWHQGWYGDCSRDICFFFPQAFLDRPLLFNYMLTLTNQGASGKPPIKWQSAALKTFHLVLDLGASIGIMCR